jgi:hypothetical protein
MRRADLRQLLIERRRERLGCANNRAAVLTVTAAPNATAATTTKSTSASVAEC